MTMLQALSRLGERMEAEGHLPPLGYSPEKISFVISLHEDGTPANVRDLRDVTGKKPLPSTVAVPQAIKRTSGVTPNFLWDKTAYVLGVTAGEGKRLAEEHAAFVERHLTELKDADDAGLVALRLFLERWTPADFIAPLWQEAMKDQNVVFALESERRSRYLHDRPAAKALWARMNASADTTLGICLVSGETAPIAVLHPSIKGVWGAQSSGASLVSFNQASFESYGHEQGLNAPMSVAAAARYGGALNDLLRRDSGHSVQIGDASTVFWAEAVDPDVSADDMAIVEAVSQLWFSDVPEVDLTKQSAEVGAALSRLRSGEPVALVRPKLAKGVRFYVLGLSPNAARLSVRFYLEDDFGAVAERYNRFAAEMRVDPPPRTTSLALWRYLLEVAVLGKRENVPPTLAGEWMRSILAGTPYPLTLLSSVLVRLRADGDVNAMRVAILRALVIRNFRLHPEKEAPVAFDPENTNRGYLLGRLFAVYEQIQQAALGNVNASIKDKFYSAAAAQPQKVFALLDKGSAPHLSKLAKQKPGYKVVLEKHVSSIMELMQPGADPFPIALAPQEQALFGLGYYHQRNEFFKSTKDVAAQEEVAQ
ncbi:type I-C CRISPR-associated protein Cas8c/Csd1 [Pannonibacter sp.]|uniref:type I-C CRISPR-associated protein Cas8c/Csd1 n=1 Tax=Pannonibacter sp. TaxID=1906786 RepID=UPI003F6F01E6